MINYTEPYFVVSLNNVDRQSVIKYNKKNNF